MNYKEYSKYISIGLFVIVAYLSLTILKPLATVIISSIILAYIFFPVYEKINKHTKKKVISAMITSILLILLISVPMYFMLNAISKEILIASTIYQQKVTTGQLFSLECGEDSTLCKKIKHSDFYLRTVYYLNQNIDRLPPYVIDTITDFLVSVPKRALELFITLFVTFYLFLDGKYIVRRLRSLLTLKEHHEGPIIKQTGDVIYGVIYGNVVIAVIEGILGTIGLWLTAALFGLTITSPILWGILMAILALLPIIGAGVVWILLAISFLINGYIGAGIFFTIYCMFFVSGIDIFIKPRVIGRRAKVHPVLIILGVVGGISVFGFIGFIIGPVVLALAGTFIEIYEKEKRYCSIRND